MKTTIRTSFFAMLAFTSVALGASASDSVNVQASRDLTVRLAIVDSSKRIEARGVIHDALATSLSASMSRECQMPIRVKVKLAEPSRASEDLAAGVYDAAVVIGASVPQVLMKGDLSLLKATDAKSRDVNRTFYLLARNDDPSLNKVLEAAFEQAVNSAGFQEALKTPEKPASNLAVIAR